MKVLFTIEEKVEVRLEGEVTFKLVMFSHQGDNQGRLGITVRKDEFDRVGIGQVIPVRLTFIGSVD
jgi:hypothetical protein